MASDRLFQESSAGSFPMNGNGLLNVGDSDKNFAMASPDANFNDQYFESANKVIGIDGSQESEFPSLFVASGDIIPLNEERSRKKEFHPQIVWRNVVIFGILHMAAIYGFICFVSSRALWSTKIWGKFYCQGDHID